jgi:hypothetical protein
MFLYLSKGRDFLNEGEARKAMDKLYLQDRPTPRLYLALIKSEEVGGQGIGQYMRLYLAAKANPHRDPSVGQYIAGGGGAAKGKGQQKLQEHVELLLNDEGARR